MVSFEYDTLDRMFNTATHNTLFAKQKTVREENEVYILIRFDCQEQLEYYADCMKEETGEIFDYELISMEEAAMQWNAGEFWSIIAPPEINVA